MDEPLQAAKEVFDFFSTGSEAGDKDLFLPPSLAASSTLAIEQANASPLILLISSNGGIPYFSLQRGLSGQRHSRYSAGISKAMWTFFMSEEVLGVEPKSKST